MVWRGMVVSGQASAGVLRLGAARCGMALTPERPGVYAISMAVLLHWRDTHTPATTRGIAKRVGLRSSSAAMRQLDAAWRAGLIDKREGHYWPKNNCVCSGCGAAHISERESA